jgi:hypothetical protein
MLRWAVLKKVLGVGAVRSWPYLVTKLSQAGVVVDGISSLCAIPLPVDVGLARRVLGSRRFLLAWLPSLSLEESLPLQAHMS